MKTGALRERAENENRVALTPDSAAQLKKLGHDSVVEAGTGVKAAFPTRPIAPRASRFSPMRRR
jgi:NAD(P) transhydrogenase subunit alpha